MEYPNSPHQHSRSCQFCEHFAVVCSKCENGEDCPIHSAFLQLHGSYIRQFHPEWLERQPIKNRTWDSVHCLCCKTQTELERHPHEKVIHDDTWKKVWKNLEDCVKLLLENPVPMPVDKPAPIPVDRLNQRDENKLAEIYEEYDKAIKNGATTMACGRIMTISMKDVEPNPVYKQLELPCVTIQDKSNYLFLKRGRMLSKMTDEEETRILGEMVKDYVSRHPDSLLNEIASTKGQTINVFSGSTVKEIEPESIETKWKLLITNIVISVKNKAAQSTSEKGDYLPAFLNITDDYSSELFWDLLPLFITSRSMFILVHGGENLDTATELSERGSVEGKVSIEEKIHRWIACIHGSLSRRAYKLHNALKSGSQTAKQDPPYPKIVLARIYPNQISPELISKMYSNIKAQLGNYENDRLQILEQLKRKNELVPKFIEKLELETPLAWELFRSILAYATKDVQYISVKKVAAIALLCDINSNPKCKDLHSVLNFYHEHGAFLYFGDVPYMDSFVILDPKWLLEQYQCLKTFEDEEHESLVIWLKQYGILAQTLCESIWNHPTNGTEVLNLSNGLLELLKANHLAAKINAPEVMGSYEGDAYFVPFVRPCRKTSHSSEVRRGVFGAPSLHFIFPKGKYLPPGVFLRFAATLTSKGLEVDFTTSEVYSDEISYWYSKKAELITISSTLTSISVRIEGLRYDNYSVFGNVCKRVLKLLQRALVEVLKELGNIEFKRALLSPCPYQDHQPHYAVIDGDVLACDRGQHTPDKNETLWLGTFDKSEQLENFQKCYSKLLDKITPSNYSQIAAELYSCQKLTRDQRDDIQNDQRDKHQRGVKLLQAVERSEEAVEKFCDVLKEFGGAYQELISDIRGGI